MAESYPVGRLIDGHIFEVAAAVAVDAGIYIGRITSKNYGAVNSIERTVIGQLAIAQSQCGGSRCMHCSATANVELALRIHPEEKQA